MGGEVDIIEGVHRADQNLISVHTSSSCNLDDKSLGMANGIAKSKFCDTSNNNVGCSYLPPSTDTASYGDGFNAAQGGVYAMQWDDEYISVWHFERNAIPADIQAKHPNPAAWGLPQGRFGGAGCDVRQHFKDMSLVLDINFCGDYGNAAWPSSSCAKQAPTCEQWVAAHPEAFVNAYWDVRYIDAYTVDKASPAASSIVAADEPLPDVTSDNRIAVVTPTAPMKQADEFYAQTVAAASTQEQPRFDAYSATGCYSSSNNWKGFYQAGQDVMMTIETCIAMCGGLKYIGVYDTACYCADAFSHGNHAVLAEACSKRCPGKQDEMCGGIDSPLVPSIAQTASKSSFSTSTGSSLGSKATAKEVKATHINPTRVAQPTTTGTFINLKPTSASSTNLALHTATTPMRKPSRNMFSKNVLRRSLHQPFSWFDSAQLSSRDTEAPGMLLSVYVRTEDEAAATPVLSNLLVTSDIATMVISAPPADNMVQSASPTSVEHQITIAIEASNNDSCDAGPHTLAPVVLTVYMTHPDSDKCTEHPQHSFVTTIPGITIAAPLHTATHDLGVSQNTPVAIDAPSPLSLIGQSHPDASIATPPPKLQLALESLSSTIVRPLIVSSLIAAKSASPNSAGITTTSPKDITTSFIALASPDVLPTLSSFTTIQVPLFNMSGMPSPPNITLGQVPLKITSVASKFQGTKSTTLLLSLFFTAFFT